MQRLTLHLIAFQNILQKSSLGELFVEIASTYLL